MSFSSRRRNYLLTPHRRDGLIAWMKSMLQHSFVLDALDTTGADTFSHFEMLIEEHRRMDASDGCNDQPSRLKQLVPTVGTFHTPLPLRKAFEAYNSKHHLTKRRHVCISFNEIRHICNLAQIMAMRPLSSPPPSSDIGLQDWTKSQHHVAVNKQDNNGTGSKDGSDDDEKVVGPFNGPKLITFDGDQTLYSDGANFETNPRLANYLYLLLKHDVTVAIVTAAGYEYHVEKYEFRISGLLAYFEMRGLTESECERFYLFGGECNYLLRLGSDYHLHPVNENGPGGWMTSTHHLPESPGNWNDTAVTELLDLAYSSVSGSMVDQNLRSMMIRKKRSVGLIPKPNSFIPREALDEAVLRVQSEIQQMNNGKGPNLPYCAFNGGSDVWIDVGNKRVGVQVLQSYLGIKKDQTIHVGDQFLNTGNDYLARDVCPCIWITSPDETTYILKSILRLAGVSVKLPGEHEQTSVDAADAEANGDTMPPSLSEADFTEIERRTRAVEMMDVYTGEMTQRAPAADT